MDDSHAPQSTDNLDWAKMASKVGWGWGWGVVCVCFGGVAPFDLSVRVYITGLTSYAHTQKLHKQKQKVTNASLSLRKYRMVVFFSNDETDTQGGLWWRPATKELMIIFRGACFLNHVVYVGCEMNIPTRQYLCVCSPPTPLPAAPSSIPPPTPQTYPQTPPPKTGTEITSLKDVLTDMNITQKPLDGPTDARLIHSGFHAAFGSVVRNVYDCVEMVIGQGKALDADGWTVRASFFGVIFVVWFGERWWLGPDVSS